MACAGVRKHAERSLTGTDCPICMESYESIKILPCKHEICSQCLDQLISRGNLLCPQCRISFSRDSNFKTKESWNLECSSCFEMKSSKEFNWCVECARLLCCLCLVRQHKSSNHTIQEWDSGIPVMASLKEIFWGVEDHPRQQLLLEQRMSELIAPVLKSISKNIVDSRHRGGTSLLQAFPFDAENLKKVESTVSGEEVLSIAAKVAGVDIKDLLHVPVSLKDPASIENSFRSLLKFGPEPNFFDNEKDTENQESTVSESAALTTAKRYVPFKIKAENGIELVRISLNRRRIVLSYENSAHVIFDLDIFNGQKFLPEFLNRSHGTELPSYGRERGWVTRDGTFDPVGNRYFLLERIWNNQAYHFQLSVIDLSSMKRKWLWNSSNITFGFGYLSCSNSGVLFILFSPMDRQSKYSWKTKIYTARRNARGEPEEVFHELDANGTLNAPVCYEIGSETFLLANNFHTGHVCLYRYNGSELTIVIGVQSDPVFSERFNSGWIVEYGNYFYETSEKTQKLRAFKRVNGHNFKVSWEFKRPNTDIQDIAVDGDRVLMAFYKEKDEFVQFEWFSLDELKKNCV